MNRIRKTVLLIILMAWGTCVAYSQGIQLRHHLTQGQSATIMTEVHLQGDSFLTGQKNATRLQMQMRRLFNITHLSDQGYATADVHVQQIRTQGTMENASFNKNLTGPALKQVMFGADQMKVDISPRGQVQQKDGLPLQQLGIQIPSTVSDTGGFEFPTFPVQPVRIGDTWTEKGTLLRRQNRGQTLSGQGVYKLLRIRHSPQGRVAVIRYEKVTDLSGLGLGQTAGLQPGQTASLNANAKGLVIQLEGEIEFNVDRGHVIQSVQQGTWNLDLNMMTGNALGNILNPASSRPQAKPMNLKQNMNIKINTRFQWRGPSTPSRPGQPVVTQPSEISPLLETLPRADDTDTELP